MKRKIAMASLVLASLISVAGITKLSASASIKEDSIPVIEVINSENIFKATEEVSTVKVKDKQLKSESKTDKPAEVSAYDVVMQGHDSKFIKGVSAPVKMRCTGYCDKGYTKSGQYVRKGIVAGKKEWLGKSCYAYKIDEDGSCGELLGIYEFLDTGYGIDGSLVNGTSIDMWFPTEAEVWNWMATYGDYVYVQIIDCVG